MKLLLLIAAFAVFGVFFLAGLGIVYLMLFGWGRDIPYQDQPPVEPPDRPGPWRQWRAMNNPQNPVDTGRTL